MTSESVDRVMFLSENSDQVYDKRITNKISNIEAADGKVQKLIHKKIHNTLPLPENVQLHLKNQTYINNLEYSNSFGLLFISTPTHIAIKTLQQFDTELKTGSFYEAKKKIPCPGQIFMSPSQKYLAILNEKQILIYDIVSLGQKVICRFENGDKKIQSLIWENQILIYGWKFFGPAYAFQVGEKPNGEQLPQIKGCTSISLVNRTILVAQDLIKIFFFREKKLLKQIDLHDKQNNNHVLFRFSNIISIIKANNFDSQEFKDEDIYLFVQAYYEDPEDDDDPCNRYLYVVKGNLMSESLDNITVRGKDMFYSCTDQKQYYMTEDNQKFGFQVKSVLCGDFVAIQIQRSELIYAVDLNEPFENMGIYSLEPSQLIKTATFLKGFALMKNPLPLQQNPPPSDAPKQQLALFQKHQGRLMNLFFKAKQMECVVQFPPSLLVISEKQLLRRYAVTTTDKVEIGEGDSALLAVLAKKCLLQKPTKKIQVNGSEFIKEQTKVQEKKEEIKIQPNTPAKIEQAPPKNESLSKIQQTDTKQPSQQKDSFSTPQNLFSMPDQGSSGLASNLANNSSFADAGIKISMFENKDKKPQQSKKQGSKPQQSKYSLNSPHNLPFFKSSNGSNKGLFSDPPKKQQEPLFAVRDLENDKKQKVKRDTSKDSKKNEEKVNANKTPFEMGDQSSNLFLNNNKGIIDWNNPTTNSIFNFQKDEANKPFENKDAKGQKQKTNGASSIFKNKNNTPSNPFQPTPGEEKPKQKPKTENKNVLELNKVPQKKSVAQQKEPQQLADQKEAPKETEESKKLKILLKSVQQRIESYQHEERTPGWFTLKKVDQLLAEKDITEKISGVTPIILKERVATFSKMITKIGHEHHRRKLMLENRDKKKAILEQFCKEIRSIEQLAQKFAYYCRVLGANNLEEDKAFMSKSPSWVLQSILKRLNQTTDQLFDQAVVLQARMLDAKESQTEIKKERSSEKEYSVNKLNSSTISNCVFKFDPNQDSSDSDSVQEKPLNQRLSLSSKSKEPTSKNQQNRNFRNQHFAKQLRYLVPIHIQPKQVRPRFHLQDSFQGINDQGVNLRQMSQERHLEEQRLRMRESNAQEVRMNFQGKIPKPREGLTEEMLRSSKKAEIPTFTLKTQNPKPSVSEEPSEKESDEQQVVEPDLCRNHSSVQPLNKKAEGGAKTKETKKSQSTKNQMLSSVTSKINDNKLSGNSESKSSSGYVANNAEASKSPFLGEKTDTSKSPLLAGNTEVSKSPLLAKGSTSKTQKKKQESLKTDNTKLQVPDTSFMKKTTSKDVEDKSKKSPIGNLIDKPEKKKAQPSGNGVSEKVSKKKSEISVDLSQDDKAELIDKVPDIQANFLCPREEPTGNDLSQSQSFVFDEPGEKKKSQSKTEQPKNNIFSGNNQQKSNQNPFETKNQGKFSQYVSQQQQHQIIYSIPSNAGGYQATSFGLNNKLMGQPFQSNLPTQNNGFNPNQMTFGGSNNESNMKSFGNLSNNQTNIFSNVDGFPNQQMNQMNQQMGNNPMAPNNSMPQNSWMNPNSQQSGFFPNHQNLGIFNQNQNSGGSNMFNPALATKQQFSQGPSVPQAPPAGMSPAMTSIRSRDIDALD